MQNRDGLKVNLVEITKVEHGEDYVYLTYTDGFTFTLRNDELDGFHPQVGDWMVITTRGFSTIAGVIIEGHVIRNKSQKELDDEHKQFVDRVRLKRLEEYVQNGDALKERVEKLHPKLRARMHRFADEYGVDFWINDAPYEMYALEGADALLKYVKKHFHRHADTGQFYTSEEWIEWLDWWWSLNTKEHNYDYERQINLVPDFGDGHSGYTAAAAYGLAKAVLQGKEV